MNSSLKIYSASAGSGKTYTLAKEFISLLIDCPENYKNILAVTFTVKATNEMKERILQNLNKIATNSDLQLVSNQKELHPKLSVDEINIRAQKALNYILNDYSQFNILTIDGFVQKVIRAFAYEANLPSHYEITLDKEDIIDEVIDELYANIKTDEQLRDWLWSYTQETMEDDGRWKLDDKIREITSELVDKKTIDDDVKSLSMSELHEFVNKINKIIKEGKEADKTSYYTAIAIKKNIYTTGLVNYIENNINQITKQKSLMLIRQSNELLEKLIDGSDVPFIYEKVGSKYDNIMIDEFQDTSQMQWKNFLPLVKNSVDSGHTALVVGDVKQAIYRWRDSDWNLLAKEIYHNFPNNENKTLDVNYRSEANIIEFNNELFSKIVEKYPLIKDLYKDVHQEVSESKKYNKTGYVRVKEIKKDEKDKQLDELLETINHLNTNGYKNKDICILVRGKSEGGKIAEFLAGKGIRVVSTESLLVDSSPVVKAIVASMRYIDDQRNKVALAYLKNFQDNIDEMMLLNLRGMGIMDMMEEIINLLDKKWVENQLIYVDAFRNVVYSYCCKNPSHIKSFLDYYDSKSGSLYIESSTCSEDDIQLMTIHKAKGLEFPIVLMPYLDWKLFKADKLIVSNLPSPFDTLSSYKLNVNQELLKKTYAKEQLEYEKEEQLIDNINLLYVALTRAKIAFYGWFIEGKNGCISQLLTDIEMGVLPQNKQKPIEQLSVLGITHSLKTSLWKEHDREKFGHIAFTDKTKDGTAKHAIMEKILTLEDIEKYTKRAVINGDMDEKESTDFINEVAQEIKNLNIEKWFNGTMTIFTETAMISDYYERRPDRIMVESDNNATVLDYKFYKSVDTETRKKHEIQVNNYIQMLKRTNLFSSVKGYLWYYNQKELVEVR